MSFSSSWLIVLFESSISLLRFFFPVKSFIKIEPMHNVALKSVFLFYQTLKEVSKSPTIIVDLSISPYSFISFYFEYFEAVIR